MIPQSASLIATCNRWMNQRLYEAASDRNLAYQQNLAQRKIAILVLGAGNWPRIERALASIVQAVGRAAVGTYEEIAVP
jgi:hypothetical protein